jgi:hypothetical protein
MKRNIKKHLPLRTCIACREIRPKQELVRLVRVSDGTVDIDTSGKRAGRGVYLCTECWKVGLNSGKLKHALRTTLTRDNMEQLVRDADKLC